MPCVWLEACRNCPCKDLAGNSFAHGYCISQGNSLNMLTIWHAFFPISFACRCFLKAEMLLPDNFFLHRFESHCVISNCSGYLNNVLSPSKIFTFFMGWRLSRSSWNRNSWDFLNLTIGMRIYSPQILLLKGEASQLMIYFFSWTR